MLKHLKKNSNDPNFDLVPILEANVRGNKGKEALKSYRQSDKIFDLNSRSDA